MATRDVGSMLQALPVHASSLMNFMAAKLNIIDVAGRSHLLAAEVVWLPRGRPLLTGHAHPDNLQHFLSPHST
jgi:hypothetical protein